MIYGLNFNGTQMPEAMKKRFPEWLDSEFKPVPRTSRRRAFGLVGIATSPEERDAMVVQATNGTRELHVEERKTAGAPFFGVYTGSRLAP